MKTVEDLHLLLESVFAANDENDEKAIFDNSADVMSVYLEALSDVHFEGEKTDWLNEMVSAIDDGDSTLLITLLKQEQDSENRFLGSQVAALFAGFRQRDSLMTVAQAVGIEALLENI